MKILYIPGIRKLTFTIIFCFYFFIPVFSQEKLGIANSNYSSTNSIFLNPASSVDSRTFFQLNLIGLNAYAYTNQIYLPDFSFPRAFSGYHEQPVIVTNNMKKFFYGNFSLEAPGFVMSTGKFGFGLFVRGHSEIDIRRMPYQLTNIFLKQKIGETPPSEVELNVRNAKISTMTWAEYGLNFGWMAKTHNGNMFSIGGNLKYLTG